MNGHENRSCKKTVAIITNYYKPDVASIANLYTQLSEYLAQEMEVTVICSVPCYLGSIPDEYVGKNYYVSDENGVHVIRVGVPAYNKSSKISRIRSLISFVRRAIMTHKCVGQQDVVLAVSQPPVFGGFIGYRIAKKTKAAFIYNIQDFNPEQMEYSGFTKNKFILSMLKRFDVWLCKKANHIITVSEDMRNTLYTRMNSIAVPDNSVINNWVDTKLIRHIDRKENPLIERYRLCENDFLVVYAGNIGIMQDLKSFIYAAKILEQYNAIKFVFIGSGADLNNLQAMVKNLNIENVIFQPYEPLENIKYVYSLGDIEIVSIGHNVTKCSMPSKTWNILACGVPVVCQVDNDSELSKLINERCVGFTIEPGQHEIIAREILHLFNNYELRLQMAFNARKLAEEEYDIMSSLVRYKTVIEKL